MTDLENFSTVGIDVSKDKLDVFIGPERKVYCFDNTLQGVKRFINQVKSLKASMFVMEATGGYEQICAQLLLKANLPVAIANAKRVRDFAKAMGILAKTDAIDAKVIATYAQTAKLRPLAKRSKEQVELDGLILRRAQLVKMISVEKQHQKTIATGKLEKQIAKSINWLTKQLEQINEQLKQAMEACPVMKRNYERLVKVPGVGNVLAMTLLADLPELGAYSRARDQQMLA